jgi:hypothetical protein
VLKTRVQNGARNDTNCANAAVEGQCVVCTICVILAQIDLMGTFELLPPNRDFGLDFIASLFFDDFGCLPPLRLKGEIQRGLHPKSDKDRGSMNRRIAE